ncbi:FAD-dependent oxidoreductase [Aquirufa sp.]|jgi:hypothetical protein|uniref:FAD-dependent oxidoreductase n=1 Tax=Aquirufa sp. TaxID=2676249 RepID=UPI0037BE36C4
MRLIFILLLTIHYCFGQKAQQVDVVIYGANIGAQLAAHAAKIAGKKTLLIVPQSADELPISKQLVRHEIKGLVWDFYRKIGKELGQFDVFEASLGVKKQVIDAYQKQSEYLVWEGMQLQEVQQNEAQLLQLSVSDGKGIRVVKAKQFIDCSVHADLLTKAGYQMTTQVEDDGMGGSTKHLKKPAIKWTNTQAPIFMLSQVVESDAILASQTAVIRTLDAMQKGISVANVKEDDIQRYYSFNPLMDGSRPDLLIDDANKSMVEVIGPWKKVADKVNGYGEGYLSTFSNDDLGARVRFNSRTPLKGVYQAYYFLPTSMGNTTVQLEVYVGRTKFPVALKLTQDMKSGWAPLGTYTFSDPVTADVLVYTKNAKGLIVADAVLWVHQK